MRAPKKFLVKVKRIYCCILLLWALSLVASPLALLCLPDDNAVLSLSSSGEEEPGEPGVFDSLEEKIVFAGQEPVTPIVLLVRDETPQTRERAYLNHVCEILLPPPEIVPL